MKTTKFLAMLLAAFALAFSFASCGDDDDEPNPTPNPPAEQITPNVVNLDGTTFNVKYGWAERHQACEDGNCMYKINLQSLPKDFMQSGHPTPENPLHSICISFIAPAADALPTGKHDIAFTGQLNASRDGGLTYYRFESGDGCGQMEIKKDGGKYTLTINPFVLKYTKYDDSRSMTVIEADKTARTTFSFAGELPLTVLSD